MARHNRPAIGIRIRCSPSNSKHGDWASNNRHTQDLLAGKTHPRIDKSNRARRLGNLCRLVRAQAPDKLNAIELTRQRIILCVQSVSLQHLTCSKYSLAGDSSCH